MFIRPPNDYHLAQNGLFEAHLESFQSNQPPPFPHPYLLTPATKPVHKDELNVLINTL